MKSQSEGPTLVVLLTVLVALGPISTDLYLPSLPAIARALEAGSGATQLTLSVFMAGFAVSQLAYGPLSDRFGRRPVLLGGLGIYLVATVACLLAPSIEALIAARFLQAVGACAGPVLGRAIVRDVFGQARAAQVMSYIAFAMAIAPALGPILGGYLQVAFGWRATFAALIAFALVVLAGVLHRLPETNARRDPTATQPLRLLANYRALAADPLYRGYVVTLVLVFCGIFSFISGSSFVLIEAVGLSPDQFGLSFAAIVAGYMAGTFASGRLTRRLGVDRMIELGLAAALAGSLPMAGLGLAGHASALTIVLPMAVFMAGAGMVLPNAMAGAVGPYPQMAGSASALLGFLQMGTAALVGAAVGHLHDGTPRVMAGAIALVSVLGALSYWRLVRPLTAARPEPVSSI